MLPWAHSIGNGNLKWHNLALTRIKGHLWRAKCNPGSYIVARIILVEIDRTTRLTSGGIDRIKAHAAPRRANIDHANPARHCDTWFTIKDEVRLGEQIGRVVKDRLQAKLRLTTASGMCGCNTGSPFQHQCYYTDNH